MSERAPAPDARPAPAAAAPAIPAGRFVGGVVLISGLTSALLLVGLLLGNVALARSSRRIDLTEEKLYTLSSATRGILERLPETALIKAFWSEDIPESLSPVKRHVEGLLDEYRDASRGRVVVEWVDMSGHAGEDEAEAKQLKKYNFVDRSGDANKMTASSGYMGLYLQYEDKHETLGPLADIDPQLEYELTTALWKASRVTTPVIGLVRDMPAFQMFDQHQRGEKYEALAFSLEKTFGTAARTYLSLDDPIAAEVNVLVVAAPKDLSDKKVFHLEQFLLRGGKVFVLLGALGADAIYGGGGQTTRSGLEDWLKEYGIDLPAGVVGDFAKDAYSLLGVRNPRTGLPDVAPYPYWPRLRAPFIDQKCPGTAGFDEVILYYPSEVVADPKTQEGAGRTLTVLATTTAGGHLRPDTIGIEQLTRENLTAEGKTLGILPVMVMLEGGFASHWKGKPSPDEKPPEKPAGEAKPGEGKAGDEMKPDGAAMDGETAAMGTEPAMGEAPPAMGEAPPAMGEAPPAMGEEPAMEPEPPGMADGEKKPETPPGMDAPMDAGAGAGMGQEKPPAPPGMDGGAKGPDGPAGEKPPEPKKDDKPPKLEEGKGVLIVLGDAGLVSDVTLRGQLADINGAQNDFNFVQNVVDWLTGSEDMLALRVRGGKPRQLDDVKDSTIATIKWLNLLGAPLLVLMSGLFVFFVRRHRR